MRRIFTTAEALAKGESESSLRWGVRAGKWVRVGRGVYLEGTGPPKPVEVALALVVVTGGVASGTLAGRLYGLDGVWLKPPYATVSTMDGPRRAAVRHCDLRPVDIVEVGGFRCTAGLRTLFDLADELDDVRWEQALESALRFNLVTIPELAKATESVRPHRVRWVTRMRRVLDMRPTGAPPTESVMETMAVQLIRQAPSIPDPQRQVVVERDTGEFVARLDLAWPELGVFMELDGQQHAGQPVYDSVRETRVVGTKGWLPARFAWDTLHNVPKTCLRHLLDVHRQANLRRR